MFIDCFINVYCRRCLGRLLPIQRLFFMKIKPSVTTSYLEVYNSHSFSFFNENVLETWMLLAPSYLSISFKLLIWPRQLKEENNLSFRYDRFSRISSLDSLLFLVIQYILKRWLPRVSFAVFTFGKQPTKPNKSTTIRNW